MKSPNSAPSATSLPRAPREDAGARFTKYMVTMGIRVACFIAMVLITPYGWYTWILGAAAVVLPYFAVVIANVGEDTRPAVAESPDRQIEAPRVAPEPAEEPPRVLRISETPRPDTDR
ncbi:DUF3099 domain-containing protein [Microbacterium sp. RD1]|uniref:DUF3099 domain-containing protein n=1 Tax=Microbacterium sp. RD1 TaxID=3457313 RepID=UPI003FA5860D